MKDDHIFIDHICKLLYLKFYLSAVTHNFKWRKITTVHVHYARNTFIVIFIVIIRMRFILQSVYIGRIKIQTNSNITMVSTRCRPLL